MQMEVTSSSSSSTGVCLVNFSHMKMQQECFEDYQISCSRCEQSPYQMPYRYPGKAGTQDNSCGGEGNNQWQQKVQFLVKTAGFAKYSGCIRPRTLYFPDITKVPSNQPSA